MFNSQDMQILEALVELRNQLKDLRAVMGNSLEGESTCEEADISDPITNNVLNHISDSEDYRIDLTPQEISELLFTPPADITPHHNPASIQNSNSDITQLKKEILILREKTEKEINDLKKSVSALSEMFGRHELEIQRTRK